MKKLFSLAVLVFLSAALLSACKSSSSDSGGAVSSPGAVISGKGGAGSAAVGGNGTYFEAYAQDGNNIILKNSGSVDTAFDTSTVDALISSASLSFGAVPLEVATNMTISAYATNPTTTGEYYLAIATSESNTITLLKWNGSSGDSVTGVHIHNGVTLTLGLNFSRSGANGLDTAYMRLSQDFWNQGTITTMNLLDGATEVGGSSRTADGTVLDKGGLLIISTGIILNDGSALLSGDESADAAGGNGGFFNARGDWNGSFTGVGYPNSKLLVNRGTVNTSGGKGHTNGGSAGWVDMEGAFGAWNSGDITAIGGVGSTGSGGNGATIGIYSWNFNAPVYNSATLNASGGNGATGGGSAGYGDMESGWSGGGTDVVNSGKIVANGGDALTLGNGGSGGSNNRLGAYGGNVRNSGAIEAKGGKGAGASSVGGNGGSLYVYASTGYQHPSDGQTIPAGGIKFSGAVTADAGAGETGGNGGQIEFYHQNYPAVGDIELFGYSQVITTGGKGQTNGGNGGSVDLYGDYNGQNAEANISNEVNFTTSGGEGVTGSGGVGGHFYADAEYDYYSNPSAEFSLENKGDVTTTGGNGKTAGGTAGFIHLYSWLNLKNTGHLSAKGGAASDATLGVGGAGFYVNVYAYGHILNSGMIESSGGNGALTGGNSGGMELWSDYGLVVNSGSIYSNGGNADASLAGSTGGSSNGAVYLQSSSSGGPFKTKNTASTIQVVGGTGTTAGTNGIIYLDNVDVTPADGTL